MKIVQRIGVFETNSSSTHTLILTSNDDWEKQKETKYKKYGVLADAKDKLYLACGCCHELFPTEEYACASAKRRYSRIHKLLENRDGEFFIERDFISCEIAVEILLRIYCEKFGEDYETLKALINDENNSGRACHMRFFNEGALYDADSDYYIIEKMFYGTLNNEAIGVDSKVSEYFDDGNVICFREYYQGMGYDED